jgi:hypothetical protein
MQREWIDTVKKNVGLEDMFNVLGSVMTADERREQQLAKHGITQDLFYQKIKELLDAKTLNARGLEMDDNDVRFKALQLIAKMTGKTDADETKLKLMKTLLDTLGLSKGTTVNIKNNISFTERLYGN